jgi:hypothetical protein
VQGFDAELPICEAFVLAGFGNISVGLGDLTRAERHRPHPGRVLGGSLAALEGAGENVTSVRHV